ncbi:MAG: XTP/dITP diphosphatase [Nitrospirae bacterium]|nr:XTP/dITP diphosphatase [Nitrospirota bacterium]
MNIILATRNKKKAEEMQKILGAAGTVPNLPPSAGNSGTVLIVSVLTLQDFPECPDVIEDGDTFEANAVKKALHTAKHTGMIAVADDSGLEVDALNGAPGVFSARYAGEPSDDKKNLEKVLQKMKDVPDEKRTARFVCCIALALPDGNVKTFLGYVEGKIGRVPRGNNGFGYDPVFYPDGHDRTFAEMSDNEKNALSHRGRALRKLQEYLLQTTEGTERE